MNRAVFLDRDGTINEEVHYCRRVEDFEILPGVIEALHLLNLSNYKIVIATNQSGISRGLLTKEILWDIHFKMNTDFTKNGVYVDRLYYCPHGPDDNCECRKPQLGMAKLAIHDLNINPFESFVVGDSKVDILFGKKLGSKTILLGEHNDYGADFMAKNLLEAVKYIIGVEK